jgi:signal transduction histidine kinase
MEVDDAPVPVRDASQSYLKLIAESSSSLLAIVNDIMDLAKIEARTLEIRPGAVDADHQVEICAGLWKERAQAKGLTLSIREPSGTPARLNTDAQRLRQILENLLSNAVKFTAKGRIELGCTHLSDAVEFTVADTGPGIALDEQKRIFRAFWQVADHHTRPQGGAGLGLYICSSLAGLLGGKVVLAHSSPGGSMFTLRLPRNTTVRPSARLLKSDQWIRSADGGLNPLPR